MKFPVSVFIKSYIKYNHDNFEHFPMLPYIIFLTYLDSDYTFRFLNTIEAALAFGDVILIENLKETVDPVLGPLLGRNTTKKGKYVLCCFLQLMPCARGTAAISGSWPHTEAIHWHLLGDIYDIHDTCTLQPNQPQITGTHSSFHSASSPTPTVY